MNDKINKRLEEIREQMKQLQESYDSLTNQCNQLRNNLYALAGAEKVLSDLKNELELSQNDEEENNENE